MRFEAVLFDLFGTLVPAFGKEYFEGCLGDMAEVVGAGHAEFVRLWTRDTYHRRVTGDFESTEANARWVCGTLGIAASDEQLAEMARIRFKFSQDVVVPRPGAIPTLAALRNTGLKLGLVSDCAEEVPRLWPDTPFAEHFQATVFSCVVKTRKPDPAMFLQACAGLGVAPEACLYVGDGYGRELSGAAALGMTPVRIAVPGETSPGVPGYEGATWDGLRVESLSQICEIVRK